LNKKFEARKIDKIGFKNHKVILILWNLYYKLNDIYLYIKVVLK